MNTEPFDPKTEVTEHAFKIPEHILGLPLATPKRRLAALLIDLAFVGAMSQLGALTLSGLIGVLGYRKIRNKSKEKGFDKFKNRFIAGLAGLGFFVLSISIISAFEKDDSSISMSPKIAVNNELQDIDWSQLKSLENLKKMDSTKSFKLDELIQDLEKLAQPSVSKEFSHADSSFNTALLSDYLRSIQTQSYEEADSLRPLVAKLIAKPEFDSYKKRIRNLTSKSTKQAKKIEELQDKVDNPSFVTNIYALANDFGLAIGWSGLYFVFALAWFKGQTLGKRLLKLRVIRLNGKPITVWLAFERLGGYAAGLATGLLGFAQIYWDPNRQAIHDKIASTVVVHEKEKTE
ncbi:RDD family protein [bacterium]|nr:MAG: RDD family protein [bacterium]